MVGCLVDDCQRNDREKAVCRLAPDDIELDDKGNCMSYLRDMEYLRKKWWG